MHKSVVASTLRISIYQRSSTETFSGLSGWRDSAGPRSRWNNQDHFLFTFIPFNIIIEAEPFLKY